jgi:hypothetical protein
MPPALRTLLIIVVLGAAGCVGNGAKRDEPPRGPGLATLAPTEQRPSPSTETDPWRKTSNSLWREGYGFSNPNPQRIRAGQEPKDF